MPALDAVRGIAILLVLFYHAVYSSYVPVPSGSSIRNRLISLSSPGYLGVELFFVISGFLITGILIDGRQGPDFLRGFYQRRARRLLPALAMILIALAATGLASWLGIFGSALFLANLLPIFGVSGGYPVLWSLGVEEQFYLVWPQVVRHYNGRRLAIAALLILASQPVLRALAFGHTSPNGLLFYTWFNLDGLALGALLALIVRSQISRDVLRLRARLALGVTLFTMAVGAPFGIDSRHRHLGASLFLTLISLTFALVLTLFLLACSSQTSAGPVRAVGKSRVLRFFGKISYGLYLVHLLCLSMYDWVARHWFPNLSYGPRAPLEVVVIRTVAGVSCAVLLAAISRLSIEEWFLRRNRATTAAGAR